MLRSHRHRDTLGNRINFFACATLRLPTSMGGFMEDRRGDQVFFSFVLTLFIVLTRGKVLQYNIIGGLSIITDVLIYLVSVSIVRKLFIARRAKNKAFAIFAPSLL